MKYEFARLVASLTIVCVIVALLLGAVNSITADKIEQSRINAENAAMKQVFSSADTFEDITSAALAQISNEYILFVRAAKSGENTIGHVFKVTTAGYGAPMELIIGVDSDKLVTGVSIISHSETPGLGAKANDIKYLSRYTGIGSDLTLVKNRKTADNEVVALTGATITSTAVTKAVKMAIEAASTIK